MDCTFITPEGKFNLRVGAVITDGARVLVGKESRADFYTVIGGRVKFGETAEAAANPSPEIKFTVEDDQALSR